MSNPDETNEQLRERCSRMTDAERLSAAAEELRDMDRRDKKADYWGDRETAWIYGTQERMEIILGQGDLDTGEYDPDTDEEDA